MPLETSPNFTAANELAYKTPMYVAKFQTVQGMVTFTITDINPAFPLWIEESSATWNPDEWVGYTCVVVTTTGQQYERIIYSNTATVLTFNESLPMGNVDIGDTFTIDYYDEFCTYKPAPDLFDLHYALRKPYISNISGGSYSIAPDEGSASSATLKIVLQDKENFVTQMIHDATGRLQKKRCIVKAGYIGLKESEMLTVFTGEVTDYKYSKEGVWEFSISDVIRALNKNLFRDATDTTLNIIAGNPIDLLLSLLISNTGDGTKGEYDNLPSGYGLDLPLSKVDVEGFQRIRDMHYPSNSLTFHFEMKDRISANDFFKAEIFRPLGMYPIVLGDGRFSAKIYQAPVPPFSPEAITENDILDIPTYDGNLSDLINEIQYSYNYDGDDFADIAVYSEADSINTRGVGDRTLEIETRGLNDAYTNAEEFIIRSVNKIFNRYANPPIKLKVKLLLRYLTIEAGDIIKVSNKFLPNLDTGNFDFEIVPMEVVKRTVDWARGSVSIELLQTGYDNSKFGAISPRMIVSTGAGTSEFTAVTTDGFEVGDYVTVYQRVLDVDNATTDWYHLVPVADDVEILDIQGTTVTTTAIPIVYQTDMRIVYNDNAAGPLSDNEAQWAYIGDGTLIAP